MEVFSREEGRLQLLAAGVQRFPSRRAGHLEPLLESELVVASSPRGDSIRDARVLRTFPRLRADFRRLEAAYGIVRLLREGTGESLPDAHLYDAVVSLVGALDAPHPVREDLLELSGHVQLLRHLGALPELLSCVRCRRRLAPRAFSFNVRASGFLCTHCAPAGEHAAALTDAVKLLRLLRDELVPPRQLAVPDPVMRELGRVLRVLFRPVTVDVGLRPRVRTRP